MDEKHRKSFLDEKIAKNRSFPPSFLPNQANQQNFKVTLKNRLTVLQLYHNYSIKYYNKLFLKTLLLIGALFCCEQARG